MRYFLPTLALIAGLAAVIDALRTPNTELQGPSGMVLALVGAIWLVARIRSDGDS